MTAAGESGAGARDRIHHVEIWVADAVAEAPGYGWRPLFADRHPYAGGRQHYAAYLEDAAGFEVELVAEGD